MIKERYKILTLTARYGIFVYAKAIVAQYCERKFRINCSDRKTCCEAFRVRSVFMAKISGGLP